MQWPWRRKPAPEPLLSDAKMKDLYDEIFLEDVSAERLYAMWFEYPKVDRGHSEWVMSSSTHDRIRRQHFSQGVFYAVSAMHLDHLETLFGRPIVVDDAEPLHLRVMAR